MPKMKQNRSLSEYGAIPRQDKTHGNPCVFCFFNIQKSVITEPLTVR